MADIIYTVNQDSPENITGFEQYSQEDRALVNSFQINNTFDPTKNYSELHILSLSDELLQSEYDYVRYKQSVASVSAGQDGTSALTIDPIEDSKTYGYINGGVKLLYHFLDDLYSQDRTQVEFYIQDISADRTELSLATLNIQSEDLVSTTSTIKSKLQSQSYFTGFRLNFKQNDLLIATNIDTVDSSTGKVVVVKLYEPLPDTYNVKSILNIVDIVSDSVAYEIDVEYVLPPELAPTLRSPNFNIDITDNSVIPTGYYNYNELFSYPINNSNSQLFSTVNEKGIDISINYSDFSNFVHFSSAQERLLNFKYKLDLINSYSASLSSIATSTTGLQGVSGSRDYYQNLLTGVVNNFDHYERFLYFESGSNSWPKSNTTKPYNNKASNSPEAIVWYADQIANAISFDNTNYSSLAYSIPTYLRDDANNENYLTFVYMVGQHFDNLWLYSKAVTDKYDADNRLNHGISKDLVAEALENFGVKLYTSNKSIEDLFTTFIGQAYQSGSEVINTYVTGSLTGSNTPIQPVSYDDYQKEVQKRIYHNLPLLLKSKGTERGLRALINCLGIPSDILDIKLYGGRNRNERSFYGDYRYYTSSLDKVRLDNTGSIVSGSTLSNYVSIIKRDDKYTDDLHPIEVGFSPTDNIDNYISSRQTCINYSLVTGANSVTVTFTTCQGTVTTTTVPPNNTFTFTARQGSIVANGTPYTLTPVSIFSSFNIDEYIGDPRNLYLDEYLTATPPTTSTGGAVYALPNSLSTLTDQIMSGSAAYDVQDFVRLIKFYDNTIFKMVKDYIPARAVADTGIIIKPHVLSRSKAKSVILSGSRPLYTGSIDTAFISAGDTNKFRDSYSESDGIQDVADTRYLDNIQTPTGIELGYSHNSYQVNYNGEVSASNITVSTRDLNKANPYKEPTYSAHPYPVSFISQSNEICLLNTNGATPSLITNPNQQYSADAFFTFVNPNCVYSASINGGSTWVHPVTFPTLFPIPGLTFTPGAIQSITLRALNKNVIDGTCALNNTTSYAPCTLMQSAIGLGTTSVTKANQFQQGVDITTWFTAHPTQILQYTASWDEGGPQVVPLPLGSSPAFRSANNFRFDQPVNTVVTITVKDQALGSICQIDKPITITECNLKRRNYISVGNSIVQERESSRGFTFKYSTYAYPGHLGATTGINWSDPYFMMVTDTPVDNSGYRVTRGHLGGGYGSQDPNYPNDQDKLLPRFFGIQSYFRNVATLNPDFPGAQVDINPALRYNIYIMTNSRGPGLVVTPGTENTEGYQLTTIAIGIDPREPVASWGIPGTGIDYEFVDINYGNIAGTQFVNGTPLYNMPVDPNSVNPSLNPITFKPIVLRTQFRNAPTPGSATNFTNLVETALIRAYVIECYRSDNPACMHQVVVYGLHNGAFYNLGLGTNTEGPGTYPQFTFKNILAGWDYYATGGPVIQPTPGYPVVPLGAGPWITTKVRTYSQQPGTFGISPNTPPD